jgi:hypothetical protein
MLGVDQVEALQRGESMELGTTEEQAALDLHTQRALNLSFASNVVLLVRPSCPPVAA